MVFDSKVRTTYIKPETEELLCIEPKDSGLDAFQWTVDNKLAIESTVQKEGGILLRNFGINSVSEFNKFVQILCPKLLDYVYRSTPRTRLGGKIYTATEYPADRSIPLHNENAYSKSWPEKIYFFSIIIADEGGETPIADSRKVYKKIDQSIKDLFEKKGVCYVRNYTPGIDLSWQEVFQTDKKTDVEKYCVENDIEFMWKTGTTELTTRQTCQATLTHPVTKEKVWFNQAHLFHPSSLGKVQLESLTRELGEENLPRNVLFGDGTPIDIRTLNRIREIYSQDKIKFKWQRGDIMVLDNILMAHSREPYKGERKVVVAMG
ncbi:MAG: TauD/TfdA family dioxygenase [Alphaproteobacteria bacterium]|jgi:hypothetical protein|nr:TauD/TfdA family dioxygenase [Alphaproteobacteria bacterium]